MKLSNYLIIKGAYSSTSDAKRLMQNSEFDGDGPMQFKLNKKKEGSDYPNGTLLIYSPSRAYVNGDPLYIESFTLSNGQNMDRGYYAEELEIANYVPTQEILDKQLSLLKKLQKDAEESIDRVNQQIEIIKKNPKPKSKDELHAIAILEVMSDATDNKNKAAKIIQILKDESFSKIRENYISIGLEDGLFVKNAELESEDVVAPPEFPEEDIDDGGGELL